MAEFDLNQINGTLEGTTLTVTLTGSPGENLEQYNRQIDLVIAAAIQNNPNVTIDALNIVGAKRDENGIPRGGQLNGLNLSGYPEIAKVNISGDFDQVSAAAASIVLPTDATMNVTAKISGVFDDLKNTPLFSVDGGKDVHFLDGASIESVGGTELEAPLIGVISANVHLYPGANFRPTGVIGDPPQPAAAQADTMIANAAIVTGGDTYFHLNASDKKITFGHTSMTVITMSTDPNSGAMLHVMGVDGKEVTGIQANQILADMTEGVRVPGYDDAVTARPFCLVTTAAVLENPGTAFDVRGLLAQFASTTFDEAAYQAAPPNSKDTFAAERAVADFLLAQGIGEADGSGQHADLAWFKEPANKATAIAMLTDKNHLNYVNDAAVATFADQTSFTNFSYVNEEGKRIQYKDNLVIEDLYVPQAPTALGDGEEPAQSKQVFLPLIISGGEDVEEAKCLPTGNGSVVCQTR